ncbi:hypothetical protein L211DRAFT_880689, partial [Terfezia boudieri ATCC MYA-4762]
MQRQQPTPSHHHRVNHERRTRAKHLLKRHQNQPPPPQNQPKSTVHTSTSRGTSRGSNKIQARSDAPLDRRGQQDSANPGYPLAFKRGQKDREAGIITGHLHDGDNQPYTWAPHGQETIPYYGIRLGEIGRNP